MRIAADIFLRTIFKKMLLYLLELEIEKENIFGILLGKALLKTSTSKVLRNCERMVLEYWKTS